MSPVSTRIGDCLRVGIPPQYVTSHLGQLSLLPSAGRKMSTDQSAVMLCSWQKRHDGWQVKLCDPLLIRAIILCFNDEIKLIIRCHINVPFTVCTLLFASEQQNYNDSANDHVISTVQQRKPQVD